MLPKNIELNTLYCLYEDKNIKNVKAYVIFRSLNLDLKIVENNKLKTKILLKIGKIKNEK